jgi:phage shock protein PspC (stress-responsive transcriptional regulator)
MEELQRIKSKGIIGGVCAGIAERTGSDTWIWRIGFILTGLPLIYLLMWIFVPAKCETVINKKKK